MKSRTIIAVAAISLVVAGAAGAGAVAVGSVVHVHNGDRVIVNNSLSCFVGASDIVCGGAASSRINADIRTDGEVVILVRPTPHGVYPQMFVKRAECNTASVCHLVLGRT